MRATLDWRKYVCVCVCMCMLGTYWTKWLDCICTQNEIPPQCDLQRRCSTSSAESVLHTDMHTDGTHYTHTHLPSHNPITPARLLLRDLVLLCSGTHCWWRSVPHAQPGTGVSYGVLNLLDHWHANTAVFSQLSMSVGNNVSPFWCWRTSCGQETHSPHGLI